MLPKMPMWLAKNFPISSLKRTDGSLLSLPISRVGGVGPFVGLSGDGSPEPYTSAICCFVAM